MKKKQCKIVSPQLSELNRSAMCIGFRRNRQPFPIVVTAQEAKRRECPNGTSATITPNLTCSRASSDTVSITFTYHTWQFIIFFTIFTITTCIFSYSFSLSL